MTEKGKRFYVPPSLLEEVENIQKEEGIFSRAEAMKRASVYSQIGRKTVSKEEIPLGKRVTKQFRI